MKKKLITGVLITLVVALLSAIPIWVYSLNKEKRIEEQESKWVTEFTEGNLQECKSLSANKLSILDTDTEFSGIETAVVSAVAKECKIVDSRYEKKDGEINYILTLEVPRYTGTKLEKVDIGDLRADYLSNQMSLDEFKEQSEKRLLEGLVTQLGIYTETTTVTTTIGYKNSNLAYTESFMQSVLSASNVSSVLKEYNNLVTKYATTLR